MAQLISCFFSQNVMLGDWCSPRQYLHEVGYSKIGKIGSGHPCWAVFLLEGMMICCMCGRVLEVQDGDHI